MRLAPLFHLALASFLVPVYNGPEAPFPCTLCNHLHQCKVNVKHYQIRTIAFYSRIALEQMAAQEFRATENLAHSWLSCQETQLLCTAIPLEQPNCILLLHVTDVKHFGIQRSWCKGRVSCLMPNLFPGAAWDHFVVTFILRAPPEVVPLTQGYTQSLTRVLNLIHQM